MVHSYIEFIFSELLDRSVNVVSRRIVRYVWQRKEIHHALSSRINQLNRNLVAGNAGWLRAIGGCRKRVTSPVALESIPSSVRTRRVGVEERRHTGEIACAHCCRGHKSSKEILSLSKSAALVIEEKKCLVLSDRASQ